jgi:hypothetical protein
VRGSERGAKRASGLDEQGARPRRGVRALALFAHEDGLSLVRLGLYAAWVVYDIAWTFALWLATMAASRADTNNVPG